MKKKIFFIHIPKTAGSSFNAFLKANLHGREHCEAHLNPDRLTFSNLDELKTFDYISGHLRLRVFTSNQFSKETYFLMTFLREPINQLLSHLNWVMYIYDIDPVFFRKHPEEIQKISLELRETDLYDPIAFISALQKFQGLFKNNQSRFFNIQNANASDVIDIMSSLDMVGITECYEESIQLFLHLSGLELEPKIHNVNQNPSYRIKKDILNDEKIRDFIYEYNDLDLAIYDFFYKEFRDLYQKKFVTSRESMTAE